MAEILSVALQIEAAFTQSTRLAKPYYLLNAGCPATVPFVLGRFGFDSD
ncbi:hypothetical protein N9Y42_05245 [Mariniblastus sp.]|nr:hypothetical protein [Mariniblastus sp.]